MRIRLTMPSKDGKRLKDRILEMTETVEEDEWSEEWELVSDVEDPTATCKRKDDGLTLPSALAGRSHRPWTIQDDQRASPSRMQRQGPAKTGDTQLRSSRGWRREEDRMKRRSKLHASAFHACAPVSRVRPAASAFGAALPSRTTRTRVGRAVMYERGHRLSV